MSEKTEKPTPKRRNELRSEGNVAKSHELNVAIALILSAWIFANSGSKLISDLQSMISQAITNLPHGVILSEWLWELLSGEGKNVALDMTTIMITFLATGVIVTLLQTRFLWAKKKIGFNFKKLNPLQGIQRIFSTNGLVEFFKAFLKVLIVGMVAYSFLRSRITSLIGLAQTDFISGLSYWSDLAISLTYRIGMAYLVLAILDYAYQRWQYDKNTRMTKEEVREEMKQREGRSDDQESHPQPATKNGTLADDG